MIKLNIKVKRYWFRSNLDFEKRFGIGFAPTGWEGWVSYLVFALVAVFLIIYFRIWDFGWLRFLGLIVALIVLLLLFLFLSKNATQPVKKKEEKVALTKKGGKAKVIKEVGALSKSAKKIPPKGIKRMVPLRRGGPVRIPIKPGQKPIPGKPMEKPSEKAPLKGTVNPPKK
jgi:hypothetical protein